MAPSQLPRSTYKKTMLIVSGPSGVGKSTLTQALLDARPTSTISISHTTRPPRSNEVDGVSYHFVTDDVFDSMAQNGEFAEYAEVFGKHYGTSFVEIHNAWGKNQSIVFDIDYQGAEQLRGHFPNAISVLILPPSLQTLRERLESRATDEQQVIERRLQAAQHELTQWPSFNYIIKNEDLQTAINDLITIYDAAEMRTNVNRSWLEKEYPQSHEE